MEQIPSREANSFSASQEIPPILWDPKFYFHIPNYRTWIRHSKNTLIFLCISRYLYIYSIIPRELSNNVAWKSIVSLEAVWEKLPYTNMEEIIHYFIFFGFWTASWSSGQGLWLLIMRSRVRFPVLPWEFFLAEKDSHGDHGLGR